MAQSDPDQQPVEERAHPVRIPDPTGASMPTTAYYPLEENEIDLRQWIPVVIRNYRTILVVVCLCLGVVVVWLDLSRPLYEGETTIWVQQTHQQLIPSLNALSIPVTLPSDQLTTLIHIIKTPTILHPAVDELIQEGKLSSLEPYYGHLLGWLVGKMTLTHAPLDKGQHTAWRDELMNQLSSERYLKIVKVSGTRLIQIRAYQPTPQQATALAEKIALVIQRFIKEDMQRKMKATQTFAAGNLTQVEAQLLLVEQQIQDYQREHQAINLSVEAEMIIKNISALDLQQAQLKQQIVGAKARIESLVNEIGQIDARVISAETLTDNPVVLRLKQQLKQDRIRLAELKKKYPTQKHLEIETLKARITQTVSEITMADQQQILSQTTNLNSLHQSIQQKIIEAVAEQRAMEYQLASLEVEISNYEKQMERWSEKDLLLGRMKREKQLQQNLYSMLKRTRQEAEIASAAELGSVLVLESAEVSDQPVWPKWRLSLLVGGFVALLLSFAVVAGSEFWRSSFKSQDEAQAEFETRYPLTTFLGVVPAAEIKEGLRLHLITNDIPHTPFSERIRSVRTRLQYLNLKPETTCKSILITSATPEEGKSTIASNLAISLSQLSRVDVPKPKSDSDGNRSVLLVDADLRQPTLSTVFANAGQEPLGLSEFLMASSRQSTTRPVIDQSAGTPPIADLMTANDNVSLLDDFAIATEVEELYFIGSNVTPPNPSELMSTILMKNFIEAAKRRYEFVVLDSPPVCAVTDPVILSHLVDLVIFVFDLAKTRRTDIRHALDQLYPLAHIGLVCHFTDPRDSHYSGSGHYGYYANYGGDERFRT